jgi:uncharacterized iron-regulated membrane protein
VKDGFKGGLRQSMSWLHTWVGLVLALLLYFMFTTGSVGYFNREVDRWMRAEPKPASSDVARALMVERALARLTQVCPASAQEWYVSLPQGRRNAHVTIDWQPAKAADGKEPEFKSEILDPATGLPLVRGRATGGGNALYAMHWALHYMPERVAMYLVGIATMFMFVAIVTGIVVHKKIFSDFFTFRPARGQRSWLDAHNVSSVMALPYFLMITYSGLVFYTYDYMPSAKLALYGSSEQGHKLFQREVYGEADAAVEPSGTKAPLAPIGPMLAQAEALWGVGSVASLSVKHPGDVRARVVLYQFDAMSGVLRNNRSMVFDAVSGKALVQPAEPQSAVGTFADVMISLHEGHFAAPLLRWLYFATGLLGAAMIATGMVLWTTKRRQQLKSSDAAHAGLRFVERLNVGTIVGLPIAIAMYFWANRLIPAQMPGREAWEMHAMFIAWALAFVHASLRPVRRAWAEQFAAAAALYALLPLVNAATTNIHLGRTLPARDWVLAGFDLTMFLFGAVFAWIAHRTARPSSTSLRTQASRKPAMRIEPTPSAESTTAWPARSEPSSPQH